MVSLRVILVNKDEADPLEYFFLVAGFNDLRATSDDLEAIVESERNYEEESMEEKF